MVGGVCSGIAAYFDLDVVWIRLAFVLLTIFTGVWFLVWLAMLIVMPAARTPEQMASARGEALSAREVMEMARRKSADIGRAAAAAARDAERNLRDTFGPRS
jgi:phage shock protein PspC (stress-responsive transcriptional regulator)